MAESTWQEDDVRQGMDLIQQLTGIVVPEYRWPVVHAEIERCGGEMGFRGGLDRVTHGDSTARSAVFAAAAIPETYMFRHRGHFELLHQVAEERQSSGQATSVLCAGSSTGEEVWSAAAVLADVSPPSTQYHRVVGWELNSERIHYAMAGRYIEWSCREGFMDYDRYFPREGKTVVVDPALRKLVTFEQVNLASDELTSAGLFDVVFFRNVSIYWNQETLSLFCDKLGKLVAPNGAIFVGPSDPIELGREDWEQQINHNARSFWRLDTLLRKSRVQSNVGRPAASKRLPISNGPVRVPDKLSPFARQSRSSAPEFFEAQHPTGWSEGQSNEESINVDSTQQRLNDVQTMADAGKYEEALDILQRGEIGSTIEGRLWKGILSLAMEQENEAVDAFRQCVFLNPIEAEYRRWLAVAYEAAGKNADAEQEPCPRPSAKNGLGKT